MRADVLVLGGGFAGLSCASALSEAGARVVVLEKRPHLGGRAYSFFDPRVGEIVDNGQHLFLGCYRQTLRFLDRIGTRSRLRFAQTTRVEFADAAGGRDALACPPWPAPWHLAGGVLGLSGLSWRDKLGLWRLLAWFASRGARSWAPELDRITARAWLDGLGQSRRLQERLFDPITIGALNERPDQASALGLAQVLRDAFFRRAQDGRLGLATVGLSELYVSAARAFIESRGGRVLTGARATAISLDGRPSASTERAGRFEADAIVCALPPSALAGLGLPPELQGPWSRLRYAPILGINLWLDQPVLQGPLIGLLGTQVHWAFNKSEIWGRQGEGQYLSLVISGAHAHLARSPAELVELARGELSRCLPAFKKARIARWTVVKEPAATISPVPGSDALRPGPRGHDSRFLLAGDWTQTGLPATIESAVASGHACAALLGAKP